jgi:hypothetical protein
MEAATVLEKGLRKKAALYEKLAGGRPDGNSPWILLGRCHWKLASLRVKVGKRQKAEESYRRAIYAFTKAVDLFPKEPLYRQELASSYEKLAEHLKDATRLLYSPSTS